MTIWLWLLEASALPQRNGNFFLLENVWCNPKVNFQYEMDFFCVLKDRDSTAECGSFDYVTHIVSKKDFFIDTFTVVATAG